jgi:hypothetical protein
MFLNELNIGQMKNILIFSFTLVLIGFGCRDVGFNNEPVGLLKTKWTLSYIQDTKTDEIINYPSDSVKKITVIFTDSLNIILFNEFAIMDRVLIHIILKLVQFILQIFILRQLLVNTMNGKIIHLLI